MRAPIRFLLQVLAASLPGLGLASAPAAADPAHLCRAAIAVAEREFAIPPGLLQAIGRVESGRRDPATGRFAPWPWTINAEGRGMYFPTREAAIAEVRQLQAGGMRSIDIGCMQVNLRHHPEAFASLEQAFDPLANARYAARFLTELQAARQDWTRSAGHYHSQTPDRADGYRARVMAAWAEEQARPGGDPAAEAMALAALAGQRGAAALANGADRARVLPMPEGGRGRGLDAYRSAPIMVVGRPVAPPTVARQAPVVTGRPSPLAFFRTPVEPISAGPGDRRPLVGGARGGRSPSRP
ncbi:lytic transglycosylase domain-containing protein [Roseomonas sp. HF4]|uniref:lytic transglycosylase domain-containing protein n=1 Tax=Roseomonas sp. HF4 TaxID=2562313 RepID=UPI001484C88A|nr:lytic transglycosylase domain-containing protein [Roseomonas sp. HF4]